MASTGSEVCHRALRIVGGVASGETAATTQLTEAYITLKHLLDEWEADGLQLWKTSTLTLTGIATGIDCTINTAGADVTATPPNKVLHAYYRNTDSGVDIELRVITKQEYDRLSPKATEGVPNQVYYRPPNAPNVSTGAVQNGTLYFYPALSTDFIADNSVYITGVFPIAVPSASGDYLEVPDYLVNAIVWGLADHLAYEYGVQLQERDRISRQAGMHKAIALAYDQEEGSIYLSPEPRWESE